MRINPRWLFQDPSVEDWKKKLRKHPKCKSFLRVLSSPQFDIVEKHEIEKHIPEKIFANRKAIRWLENQLDLAGQFEMAQMIRYDLFLRRYFTETSQQWCHDRVVADLEMCWLVQREIYLREEAQALSKGLALASSESENAGNEGHLATLDNEFKSLNDRYWIQFRKIGMLNNNVPEGPLLRGFEAWRKNPDWYLSEWLRKDCSRKGGCCGRDCGCCEKARDTHRHFNRGHCSTACGCCVRTRGMTNPEKLDDFKDFKFQLNPRNTPYSWRVNRAYIWGVELINQCK